MAEEEEEALALLSEVLRCSVEDEDAEAVALQRLIKLSLSPGVRSALATRDTVSSLLPRVIQESSSLLLLLKLLRNLCAGESFNQEAFLRSSGVHSVAHIVDRTLSLQSQSHMEMVSTLKVCLQLLGNACGGGLSQKDAVWKAFFPDRFKALALVKDEGIMEPLCMVIYTCSHEDINRLEDLCHYSGALLLSVCLQAVAPHGDLGNGAGDWMYLLILDICSRKSFVPSLFASLRFTYEECIRGPQFSSEQVTLLGCLVNIMDGDKHFHDIAQQNKIDLPALIEFLAKTLRDASSFYLTSHLTTSSKASTATGPCGIPVIDVLGYILELLKVFSALDCGDQQLDSRSQRLSVIGELLRSGVIELCLDLLKGLGPPELVYRAMQHSNSGVGSVELTDHAKDPLTVTRVTLPYQGYRRDLVAIIGNAAYGNRAVQDVVRHSDGLFLLLQQCVVDEGNPFLREWGLWAVRNLIHDNVENAKELAELQLRGPLTPVELAEKGYQVEMDPSLGRPKLVNLPSGRH